MSKSAVTSKETKQKSIQLIEGTLLKEKRLLLLMMF